MERNQTYQQQKKTIGMPTSRDGLDYLVERAWRMQLASPADAERRATSSWDEFWERRQPSRVLKIGRGRACCAA